LLSKIAALSPRHHVRHGEICNERVDVRASETEGKAKWCASFSSAR
jgi:hypothetical protein